MIRLSVDFGGSAEASAIWSAMVSVIQNPRAAEDAGAPLTDAERAERADSITKARAQVIAGEVVEGEQVFRWARSLGTDNELPRPGFSKTRI